MKKLRNAITGKKLSKEVTKNNSLTCLYGIVFSMKGSVHQDSNRFLTLEDAQEYWHEKKEANQFLVGYQIYEAFILVA